jgi:starch phosphorylase
MHKFSKYKVPYSVSKKYSKKVAYFSMEYAIDQALKIYAGGLGFLAGSHMRSAYALKQNMIGIGILWKFGYYDQTRNAHGEMDVLFMERHYNFLENTGIEFTITVSHHPVIVKVYYLAPEVFGTAPLFLLSTYHPDNDHLSQTICHKLYSNNVETKVAQYMLLGLGGARLLEILGYDADVYHMNEAHALPAVFHLYHHLGVLDEVRERVVFTTHTPIEAGNEKHDIHLLNKMNFFGAVDLDTVRQVTGIHDNTFNQSLAALRLARVANGVSAIHGDVSRSMWGHYHGICQIKHITNAQNHAYWHDPELDKALYKNDNNTLVKRKKELKKELFDVVADQTGKIFSPDVITLVWARRYAGYKRAELLTRDIQRFEKLVRNQERPVQLIWAGKPYPRDFEAVSTFNYLVNLSNRYENVAVLTGYELSLSKLLKQGSDIWLNTPRIPREASGTSGMTAAMNGSINLSTQDGWIPEFARHMHNCFLVPKADSSMHDSLVDEFDYNNIKALLENIVIPMYYDNPKSWIQIMKNSMKDVIPFFGSDRMADEYYTKMYNG